MKKAKREIAERTIVTIFITAAVFLIFCGISAMRAQGETKGCSIKLMPSEPAVDNGIADIYGYYNLDSEVEVGILVRTEQESAGIQKIECRITDGSEGPGEVWTQILYEDEYCEEPDEPEEPEEPDTGDEEAAEELDIDEGQDQKEENSNEEEDIPEEPEEEENDTPVHEALGTWEGSLPLDTKRWNGENVTVYIRVIDFDGIDTENSVRLDIDITRPALSISYDNNEASGTDAAGNYYFNGGTDHGAARTATLIIRENKDHFSAKKALEGIHITARDTNGNVVDAGVSISAWTSRKGAVPDKDVHTAKVRFLKDAVYTLEFSYTDEAGNESDGVDTSEVLAPWNFVIDTTAPVLMVSYDDNDPYSGSCYQNKRTATIQIRESNFDPDRVNVMITNTAGEAPSPSDWTVSPAGDGKDPVYTATVVFEKDGDYIFHMNCTDLAGNYAAKVRFSDETTDGAAFTIDRTDPVVILSYDNNEVKNERYFGAPRTATVTITEHNFDMDLTELNLTSLMDEDGKAPPLVTWRHDGDIHTATIAFSSDGKYKIDISLRDRAGNRSGTADVRDSAAAWEFTIDTTEPKTQILGVDDGCAYRGKVEPKVHFYDPNLSGYELVMTRTRLDEMDVDVTEFFFPEREITDQGGDLLCQALEKIRDNDGIYTLVLRAFDLAGNENESSVTFSVNRFGSVYVFSDYLISLIRDGGIYTQKIEEDLVITEYNADRLLAGSLLIDITRDGRPVMNVNYRRFPSLWDMVNRKDHGWYEYRYVIDKNNFLQDGIYKISVSSEDEAGNTPDNAEATGMGILFRVDSTAPEITGTIRTDENSRAGDVENFEYSVYDTMGLGLVEIYVNGRLPDQKITDFRDDQNYYSDIIHLDGSASNQNIRLVATDLAGNITVEEYVVPPVTHPIQELFTDPGFALESLAHDGILIPCIEGAAAAAVVILILFFVMRKRRL